MQQVNNDGRKTATWCSPTVLQCNYPAFSLDKKKKKKKEKLHPSLHPINKTYTPDDNITYLRKFITYMSLHNEIYTMRTLLRPPSPLAVKMLHI